MKSLLNKIISWSEVTLNKAKAIKAYDEALSLHSAKDYKQAFPIMKQAAELGHPSAMSILGSMYLLGNGVSENGNEAERWLKASLDSGFSEAGSVLGMAYVTGKAGVKIQREKGIQLLTDAAQSGDNQAAEMLELIRKGVGIFAKKSPKGSTLH